VFKVKADVLICFRCISWFLSVNLVLFYTIIWVEDLGQDMKQNYRGCMSSSYKSYRSFPSDVTAAILVYQNNEMAAILVYGTGISSFLFKYCVLFHHPTGATDHVSENDLYVVEMGRKCFATKSATCMWRAWLYTYLNLLEHQYPLSLSTSKQSPFVAGRLFIRL
jgi:hypothetical protein